LFPDNQTREETLLQLAQCVADLAQTIFTKARKTIMTLISLIDQNHEFLCKIVLNQLHFATTPATDIIDFVSSNRLFVVQHQTFFNALSCINQSLFKVIGSCSDSDVKSQLMKIHTQLSTHAIRFSYFIGQFYINLSSVIVNHVETAVQLLQFPTHVLCSYGMAPRLVLILRSLNDFIESHKIATHNSIVHFDKLLSLLRLLEELPTTFNQFNQVIKRNNKIPLYPIFKKVIKILATTYRTASTSYHKSHQNC
jgi:hypothetical protein